MAALIDDLEVALHGQYYEIGSRCTTTNGNHSAGLEDDADKNRSWQFHVFVVRRRYGVNNDGQAGQKIRQCLIDDKHIGRDTPGLLGTDEDM